MERRESDREYSIRAKSLTKMVLKSTASLHPECALAGAEAWWNLANTLREVRVRQKQRLKPPSKYAPLESKPNPLMGIASGSVGEALREEVARKAGFGYRHVQHKCSKVVPCFNVNVNSTARTIRTH